MPLSKGSFLESISSKSAHWDSKALAPNLHDCVQLHDARVTGHIIGNDLQKQASRILFPLFHPQDMPSLCAQRLRALSPDFEYDLRRCKWDVIAKQLKRCSTHIAMCTIKTYTNGWCTTHRFHESVRLPCIFGCQGPIDTLAHYATCSRLWLVVGRHSRVNSGNSVLMRLGIQEPSPQHFKDLAVAFTVYHALKLGHRELVNTAVDDNNFREVASKA